MLPLLIGLCMKAVSLLSMLLRIFTFRLAPTLIAGGVLLFKTTNPQAHNGAASHHRGPAGFLDDIQEELIAFVADWRDRGMPVTCFALVRKIGQLKPSFLEKSSTAHLMCISRFLFTNNLVHRDATHSKVAPCSGCPQVRGTNSRSKVRPQHGPYQLEVW